MTTAPTSPTVPFDLRHYIGRQVAFTHPATGDRMRGVLTEVELRCEGLVAVTVPDEPAAVYDVRWRDVTPAHPAYVEYTRDGEHRVTWLTSGGTRRSITFVDPLDASDHCRQINGTHSTGGGDR